jgi:threonine aldolase
MLVDLRSDTVTRPTAAMRDVIARATVGDDVYGDDPSVNALEERVAELLGKEAALFVPSGTMSNQLAIRAQTRLGDDMILHARAHIHRYEGGGAAMLSGVTTRTVDSMDGGLPVDALEAAYHDATADIHLTQTSLVAMENTHNLCGGLVLPEENVRAVARWTQARGVALHLDGARLWNAAVASGRTEAELAAPFDTVSVCFSKGLGAPVGSALAGSAATIERARRFRKVLGGGMRQAGLLAAAALHALEHHRARLADDHRRAKAFAHAIASFPGLFVDPSTVHTNLVYFAAVGSAFARPCTGDDDTLDTRLTARGVLMSTSAYGARAAFHLDVDDEGLERAIEALRAVTSDP